MGSRLLMCPPDHYNIDYVINPWMEGNIHQASQSTATQQWQLLYQLLKLRATTELIAPQSGWPDMVFTANAGLVLADSVVLSRFRHPQRQGETPFFKEWFQDQGFTIYELPLGLLFEGAGDALMDREGRWLWAGYGFRTDLETHPYLAEWFGLEVLSLRLIDPRFYHLDTCLCPLADGYLLYYPPAFDAYSNTVIERRIPEEKRIVATEVDAVTFACNAITIGKTLVLNQISGTLFQQLKHAGCEIIETSLTEFMKAGGSAKCLTLELNVPLPIRSSAPASVNNRVICMKGHLLDSGLLSRVLDAIATSGGSFKVLNLQLGAERHSPSSLDVQVTAPSQAVMTQIVAQAIALGASLPPQTICDNPLVTVTETGVAPKDFYVTTIYPTDVRVNCQWVPVQQQRMDAVIVVDQTPKGPVACCKLLRDLQIGDRVIVGTKGIRTRHLQNSSSNREFSFMGAGVSSERCVELDVEQVAWELHRIRDRQGKVVVVAGPVVIHTGSGPYLAQLIRQGYVQALLGGNAIAVHDIEQALQGTSLGNDLCQGASLKWGHRHHLQAINTIRKYGSIANAVEQGVLTQGVMYECITHAVPFSLAGSIRDDGPLPDTEMNLIQAQADYQRLLVGADLILMLSSMLHSIGVGNMTPAGVKLICVDINPAVVTKLQDRGSLESVGIVADVGLFLTLLTQHLVKLSQSAVSNSF